MIATALTLPVVIMAYGQQVALSWISSSMPVRQNAIALTHLWAGSPGLVWPVFGLAALGGAASVIAGRRGLTPGTVALPWLVAPPAVLLAISTAHPVYDQRYVEFGLPALAIRVASGINWLWRIAAGLNRGTPDRSGRGRSVLAWLAPGSGSYHPPKPITCTRRTRARSTRKKPGWLGPCRRLSDGATATRSSPCTPPADPSPPRSSVTRRPLAPEVP